MKTSLILPLVTAAAAAVTQSNANAAYTQLQTWYNKNTGIWSPSTGWWNSANCLTVIADLAKIDSTVASDAKANVYANTYTNAQKYNLQMDKTVSSDFLMQSWYANQWPMVPAGQKMPPAVQTDGFLNNYYDDEGWWALAWIAVYDVTGNEQYLEIAEDIFSNIAAAYNTTPCNGGVWWDKAHTYVNAIANELFLDVAAHLANRAGSNSSTYLNWAKEEWSWFKASGMINSQNLVNDGLTSSCKNNGGTVWSYNQGVILGGLTELARATKDSSYITEAKTIADAAIAHLTDSNGVLHDSCEPNCGGDGTQFKGVFARNLQILQQYSAESRYASFLQTNADAIWKSDRSGNSLSVVWSGPFDAPANASTQSSAMDALVGALATA